MSERRVARRASLYRVHYALGAPRPARPLAGLHAHPQQVAGHSATHGDRYLGILQSADGRVLKPILSEAHRREVDFYERLAVADATCPDLVELRSLVPRYYGCVRYTYNGYEQEYIVLEDLTYGMVEPCVMDVKIGRRTWEPQASPEKIAREQSKYAASKNEFAFCIPGFHVHRVDSGRRMRYGKDYGKRLKGEEVKEALRIFLNAGASGWRGVLVALLAAAWRAARWAAGGGRATLAASSLLLLYDAAPLTREADATANATPEVHNHSTSHDYASSLGDIRRQYRSTLRRLQGAAGPPATHRAKLVDFAHAHLLPAPAEPDNNFKEGIDNLVKMLEELLAEADHE